MLFSPDVLCPPQEGLVLNEVLVWLPDRKAMYMPIPIGNITDEDISLEQHRIVGHLESVKTEYSAAVQPRENLPDDKAENSEPRPKDTQSKSNNDRQPQVWDSPVNADHLTEAQQKGIRQMLREKCQAFAFDEDDVGCIPSLQMHIILHDTSPVQKTYMSVPISLHK